MNDQDRVTQTELSTKTLSEEKDDTKMGHTNQAALTDNQTLSTLQLWQAHLKALSVASDEPHHEVEIVDLSEQTSSTVVVSLPDGQPLA